MFLQHRGSAVTPRDNKVTFSAGGAETLQTGDGRQLGRRPPSGTETHLICSTG